MLNKKNFLQQNKGFSLIELLVAIAIISILTVPLLRSFDLSGRIRLNARTLQDATTVASSIVEAVKSSADIDGVENLLNGVGAVDSGSPKVIRDADGNVIRAEYKLTMTGDGGESFTADVKMTPDSAYDYTQTAYKNMFEDATVIYRELVLYDEAVLSLIENHKIDYTDSVSLQTYKLNIDPVTFNKSWITWTPQPEDMVIRETYGNLFADEYVAYATEDSAYKTMVSKFNKSNIIKTVDVDVTPGSDAASLSVKVNTAYAIDYDVVYKAEDPDKIAVNALVPVGTPLTFDDVTSLYRYIGKIKLQAEEIELTVPADYPIYLLYSKAIDGDAAPVGFVVDEFRFFKKVNVNVAYGAGVGITPDAILAGKKLELYMIEQSGNEFTRVDTTFSYTVKNQSDTQLFLYTNERLDMSPSLTVVGDVSKVRANEGTTEDIAVKLGDTLTDMYRVTVVISDKSGEVYSVTTD